MTAESSPDTAQPTERDPAAAHALFAATAQIGLAMRESQDPVADLSGLLGHLAETLQALRAAPFGASSDDAVPVLAVRGLLEQVQSDVFKGIQQLQFYDRLVQHLSVLQEYLISVANELSSEQPAAPAQVWDELNEKLRQRLMSDQQRGLLDRFLRAQSAARVAAQAEQPGHSDPGSSEGHGISP